MLILRRGPFFYRDKAIEALSHASAGGGGINIHDGLAEAAKYIRQSDKPIRHLITLTDGADTVQQEGARDLVQQLRAEKVTLSSIAIGNGKDVTFLQGIARVGGGRTFLTDQATNLPTILTQEAQAVIQPFIVEQDFVPSRGAPHPILRGFEQAPSLKGYVITTPRQSAQVLLATPRGDPLLVAWQYGLGHAIAWTSDLKGQWGGAWVNWDQFPRFAAQLLGWLLPQQDPQRLAFQSTSSGSELVLTAQAQDALGRPQPGLNINARLIATDNISTEVALREVAAGQYRATVNAAVPGAYMVQLSAQDQQGQPFGAVTAGAVVPQSAEYRSRGANPALLEQLARATDGRIDPAPTGVFAANGTSQGAVQEIGLPLLWLALLLLPFDIGLRRLLFGREQVATVLRRVGLASRESRTKNQGQPAVNDSTAASAPANRTRKLNTQHSTLKTQNSDLDRLREAQERARKKARGEE